MDEILTVQEVADFLKVTTKTVYSLVRDDQLPSFRVGRSIRFRRADLEAYMKHQFAPLGSEPKGVAEQA